MFQMFKLIDSRMLISLSHSDIREISMKNQIQARKNYSGVSCKFVGFLHGESVPVFKLKNNYLPITDEF